MNRIIEPSRLAGSVRAPSSKSCAHRLLIGAALSDAPCDVLLESDNADIRVTAACLSALGATVERENGGFRVTPVRDPAGECLMNCGESGSTLRFLLPVTAALGRNARFIGAGRLPERPHTALCEALRRRGARIDGDTLPMTAAGQLKSGCFELPGNISSQYVSGLLMALPLLDGDSEIVLTAPLESASYVALTRSVLTGFGIVSLPTARGFAVPGRQKYVSPVRARVEGDWSAAAFWLAANAAGADIDVDGLNEASAQSDRAIRRMTAALFEKDERVLDVSDCPDLVPALAAAAALVKGRTRIVRAGRLRYKECDRLAALRRELGRMGAAVRETEDGLTVDGGTLRGARVSGWGDHRIVMALAVAAAFAEGETVIEGAEAVEKSYPAFWKDYKALGGICRVEQAGT